MDLIPSWLWFIAGLGFLILELNTATFFFGTVGFGALVASLVDFLFPGEIGSFIAFVAGTGLAAYLAWKFDIYSSEGGIKTGADRLINERGTVDDRIDPAKGDGIVVVNGERWRADSLNDESIEKGETVEVKSIDGTSLVVVPCEKSEQGGSSQ